METKFTKFSKTDSVPKWRQLFTGADSWLEALQILLDKKEDLSWSVFYVVPPMITFCIELYIKAIVSYKENTFDNKKHGHKTTEILSDYAETIEIFKKIVKNKKLFKLLNEYQNTIYNTRFGETSVSINSEDQKIVIDTIYELRQEMCKLTGLP